MNKKVCIVTGGSQGIGKETALELARLGASVVVVCRDRGRGETAVSEIKSQTGNQSVDLMLVDLSSQTQIRQFAIEFAAKYSRLDVLINNAGIIPRERQLSEDGIEMTFAVNHLAPFLLTNLLLPMMKATKDGRIITVASQVHSSQLDFDNLQSEKRFHKLEPYMQSKLANILFTLELARRLQGSGLTANCLHPGVIRTGLLDDFDYMHNSNGATATKHGKRLSQPVATGGASAAEGAKMSIYLATSEDVANITGVYFQNGKQAKARDIAYDKAVAEKLWQVSLEMSGWREDSATPPDIENQEEPDLEEEDEEIYTFPVSFAQQRLWFVDQLDPGKAVYNIPYHHQTRWKGALNVPALEYALVELVARHEPLRTTFMVDDGEPVQVIRAKVNTSLPVIDLTHLQADEQAAEVDRIINEEARHTFDLEEGPLFYAKLLKLAEDDHVFIFMVHHITVDASSLDIMAEELAAFYEAFIAGKEADIPELPLQYADFVIWQREWMQGNVEKEQLDYWKKQLGGQLPVLELPTDRPRPKRQQNNGSWEWFRMPPALGQQIRDFSRSRSVSLYMTMMAGFKVLMHRYSGQDEIIVGSPTANRTQPELEKLIAFFINPVVLRSSFADNPTFGDYLKTVRKIAMGAFAHQELPFDRLVEELKLPRDLSYHPLFQVGFTLQGAPTLMKLPGLKAEAIEFSNGTSPFDLMSELWETEAGGIDGRFEYDTDLFDHTTIQRLMAHYQLLLKNLIENPDIPIGQIPLLTPSEYQQIVVEWNQTTITLPSVQLTHELIAQQAMQTPDAPALVFAEQQMSYAELNGRSNQLAHTLQANGIGPEEKVGIFLDRSFEMVIAVLAVFKAGGAYVPLDPAYPPDRIAYMVADSGMSMILTAELLLPNVLDYKTAVLCLDRDWDEQIGHHSDTNPISGAAIDNLAYIIYTSGSTGKPKGVMVSHDALVSHCITIKAHYDLTPQDTVLQFSSFSFDASLEQLLPSLMSGAKVVLRNLEVPSVSLFCQQMIDMKMTVVDLPTAYWHQLTQDWDAVVAWLAHEQLRLLIVGGEAMSAEHLQHWHEAGFSGVRLLNAYGPTETTITALICDLSSLSAASQLDRVPIGRPIRGRRVYILDKQLQPVPIGVSGEIHIAGIGLARGYLNRPELTAEKFIPNPFASESGSRLYKTGDLGRYLADGRIEFLGRVDNQVKIRGFRIELGEIEAVLQQQTAVQDAVVVARDNNETGLQLVAYVVGEDLAVADLQTALGQVLPAYMVPTAIVPLDAFPLTPNGKIDHKALPSPMETIVSNYVSPRNDVETVIANIWAETLKLPRVGIDDNFFELGGHSLLGTQLVTRLRQTLRIELPLRALFDAPTVAGIAEVVLQPPNSPARVEKVAQLLIKLSQLSEEEAAQLLNKKR